MKMKIKDIATAYGVTESGVKKWGQQKRQRAIKLLSAKVDPQIMELVGEVQRLCYAASCVVGETVTLSTCIFNDYQNYHVYYISDNGRVDIADFNDMSEGNLIETIRKLEAIIYGDMK